MDDRIVHFVVRGEPASKANARRLVKFGDRVAVIKSKKALDYVSAFQMQCPALFELMKGDLAVIIKIYYASRRPDLDESVILDAMQGLIYENDRQVKAKMIYWGLDKENPRSVIVVSGIKSVEDEQKAESKKAKARKKD